MILEHHIANMQSGVTDHLEHQPRLQRMSWSHIVSPEEPWEVPYAYNVAICLGGAVVAKSKAGESVDSIERKVFIERPRLPSADRFMLVRFRGRSRSGCAVARFRALVNCAKRMVLSVEGGPTRLLGRLEGELSPEFLSAMGCSIGSIPGSLPKVQPSESSKLAKWNTTLRPRTLEEYVDSLESYLLRNGPTSLRKLGTMVAQPRIKRCPHLKKALLEKENRARFVIDLQGCVYINHSRCWGWAKQAAVTRPRRMRHVWGMEEY